MSDLHEDMGALKAQMTNVVATLKEIKDVLIPKVQAQDVVIEQLRGEIKLLRVGVVLAVLSGGAGGAGLISRILGG